MGEDRASVDRESSPMAGSIGEQAVDQELEEEIEDDEVIVLEADN